MQNLKIDFFSGLEKEIEAQLEQKETVTIAIDGRCGSGKTTLAGLLAAKFDSNVFHMDDFFLPLELRTAERLQEIGGNFHYERWEREIGEHLRDKAPFSYQIFDCSVMKINAAKLVTPKRLNIIEGSYCLHPKLQKYYDIMVFVTVNPEIQKARILKRNGQEKWSRFESEWIPKEEMYFQTFSIQEKADFCFLTDS
ncbi:uridine kinase family protein [Scatolibacter rhodanostii]|uniref:uridine kinase family protein n=1 Tax=Scatolibacter rhodanostii TaxID=2014781 RepID=UPI000C0834C1|nr:uridine kinase [Scatolibacter rhodanostii]